MKKYYSIFKAKLPFIAGITLLSFLASCSSSNQFASSFGKRKYTKGYYFDNVASVKPVNKQATGNTSNNTVVTNEEKQIEAAIEPVVAKQTPSVTKAIMHNLKAAIAPAHKAKHDNSGAPAVAANNTTTSVNAAYSYAPDNVTSYHHGGDGGGGNEHHFGRKCLICLGIVFICAILTIATIPVGGGGGAWLLFAFIAYIAAICAIVFLVLWLVNLGN
jgi:hypothetical protein